MLRVHSLSLPVVAMLLLAACGGEDTNIALCPELGVDDVLPTPVLDPTATWDVTYTATATSGATVTSLQYRDVSGTLQTVANPSLPFTYSMTARPAGTRVALAATATAPPGTVTLEIVAVSGPPNAQERMRRASSCGNQGVDAL